MAATASALQFTANRANSVLSTGPRTPEGKLAASRNSQSHGLTARHALLPNEDASEYEAHHTTYATHYRPKDAVDQELVIELADLQWRLRRVPAFEAQVLNVEVRRLTTDPELTPLIKEFHSDAEILALAFIRLVQSKVLPNLLNQEARLARRVDKIQRNLELSSLRPKRRPQPAPGPPPEIICGTEEIANQENEANPASAPTPAVSTRTGRNESCPCRSGLKFKRCCLNKPPSARQ